VRGTTIATGVGLGRPAGIAGIAVSTRASVAGALVGTTSVADMSVAGDADGISVGTLLADEKGMLVPTDRADACVSGAGVALICSGRPQPASKININTNHRRRTAAHVVIELLF